MDMYIEGEKEGSKFSLCCARKWECVPVIFTSETISGELRFKSAIANVFGFRIRTIFWSTEVGYPLTFHSRTLSQFIASTPQLNGLPSAAIITGLASPIAVLGLSWRSSRYSSKKVQNIYSIDYQFTLPDQSSNPVLPEGTKIIFDFELYVETPCTCK